jgi:hypothetical protein
MSGIVKKDLTNLYSESILCPEYGDIRFGIVMSKKSHEFFGSVRKGGLARGPVIFFRRFVKDVF